MNKAPAGYLYKAENNCAQEYKVNQFSSHLKEPIDRSLSIGI
jgi:hypothetical protein